MNSAGIAWTVAGSVLTAALVAVAVLARHMIREDFKVTVTGPSLKFEKRAIPVPRPPAPRVLILGSDGSPEVPTSDITVRGGRF